jgi:hypothetical protein
MAEGVGREEIARLNGREVLDANGESVGYVDVIFADDGTGEPEWLGVWNGVWHTKPRVLVPVEGIRMEGDRVRVPWTKDQIEGAPNYDEEDNRGLFSDDPDALGISRDKERIAYAHYGLTAPEAPVAYVARLRVWRVETMSGDDL